MLPSSLYDKPTLRSGPKGVTLARTPAAQAERNLMAVRATLKVTADGAASGTSVTEGSGTSASVLRGMMTTMERQDPAELGRRALYQQNLAGAASVTMRSPRDRIEPYSVAMQFAVTDKVFSSGDARAVIVGPRLVGRPVEQLRAIYREGRSNDFVCIANTYREDITVEFPAGGSPRQLPADVAQRHALGDYSAQYRRTGNVVRIVRQFVWRPTSSVCTVDMVRALAPVLDAADSDFRKVLRLPEAVKDAVKVDAPRANAAGNR